MTSGEVLVDLTVLVAADATAIDMNGGMIGAAVVTEEMIEALIAVMIEAMIGTAGTIEVLIVIVGTIEAMIVIGGTIVVMIVEMIVVASGILFTLKNIFKPYAKIIAYLSLIPTIKTFKTIPD